MTIRKVGVVGRGLMGGGIAQTCAQTGYQVVVCEVNKEASCERKLPSLYSPNKHYNTTHLFESVL